MEYLFIPRFFSIFALDLKNIKNMGILILITIIYFLGIILSAPLIAKCMDTPSGIDIAIGSFFWPVSLIFFPLNAWFDYLAEKTIKEKKEKERIKNMYNLH